MRLTRAARFGLVLLVMLIAGSRSTYAETVTLMWDLNQDPAVAGYIVYVGTQSGVYPQVHDVGAANWFVLQNATPGQRYYFSVASYATGPLVGPRSAEVSGYSNAPPSLLNPGNQSSVVGTPVTLQLSGSDPYGEPLSYGATGLPPGLGLVPSTGFIQGTGTSAGTYAVNAWVTDGVLSASRAFTWTMTAPAPTEPPPASEPPPSSEPPPPGSPPPADEPPRDLVAPSLAVLSPSQSASFTSTVASLSLTGTASDDVGVTVVSWVNSRGGSGVAMGTSSWTIAGIPLLTGSNVITLTAFDAAGNQGSRTVTVTYVDSEAPVMALVSPVPVSVVQTFAEEIVLAGTASDNIGVVGVSWTTDSGRSGVASGTTRWSIGPLDLEPGATRITVTGEDAAGNRGHLVLTVTRLVPAEPSTVLVMTPDGETYETSEPSRHTITGTSIVARPGVEPTAPAAGTEQDSTAAPEMASHGNPPVASGAVSRFAQPRETTVVATSPPTLALVRASRTAPTAPAATTTSTTRTVSLTQQVATWLAASSTTTDSGTDAAEMSPPVADTPVAADRNAPEVRVTSPTDTGRYDTADDTVFLVGVAVDDIAVVRVTWASDRGASGVADGTSVWSAEVPLEPGENVITVVARDAAGNIARAFVRAIRGE